MKKFDVWIPNLVVEAENHLEALKKASEFFKSHEQNYIENHGEAEELDE